MKGHSGNPGNEWADELADRGAVPAVSPHSHRWSQKEAEKYVVKPQEKKQTRKGQFGNAPHLTGKCRKCGLQMVISNLSWHEDVCRGSEVANRTCKTCGSVFVPVCGRRNHEANLKH